MTFLSALLLARARPARLPRDRSPPTGPSSHRTARPTSRSATSWATPRASVCLGPTRRRPTTSTTGRSPRRCSRPRPHGGTPGDRFRLPRPESGPSDRRGHPPDRRSHAWRLLRPGESPRPLGADFHIGLDARPSSPASSNVIPPADLPDFDLAALDPDSHRRSRPSPARPRAAEERVGPPNGARPASVQPTAMATPAR